MDGANEARLLRSLTEGGADLGHNHGQAGIRHKYSGPDPGMEILFGEDTRTFLDQGDEQIKRLGCQMHVRAIPLKLTRLGVHLEVFEYHVHEAIPSKLE
jgi:hypothetical protein